MAPIPVFIPEFIPYGPAAAIPLSLGTTDGYATAVV